MNLSPVWVRFLQEEGFEALHWSTVGDPKATDAATEATGPSVIQVRTQDVLPDAIGGDVVRVLRTHATELEQAAIVSVDKVRSRVRVQPIRRG